MSEGFETWSWHIELQKYLPDMENVTLYCRDKAFQEDFYCYKLNVIIFFHFAAAM